MLKRLDSNAVPQGAFSEIRLFIKVRNEAPRLPYWLQYYAALGVDRIFAIDNASTDATVRILLESESVHLFQTEALLCEHDQWINYLLNQYGRGYWCVVVDADEFLLNPFTGHKGLRILRDVLEQQRCDAMLAVLIDLYSKEPLGDVRYDGGDPLKTANYFDADLAAEQYETHAAFEGKPLDHVRLAGGIRKRVFNIAPVLTCFPFFKFNAGMWLTLGSHELNGARRHASVRLALLHFKFFDDFFDRVQGAVKLKQYWRNSLEYRAYERELDKNANPNFINDQSREFLGHEQLLELGFVLDPKQLLQIKP